MEGKYPESVRQIHEFADTISEINNVKCDPENDLRDAIGSLTLDFTIGNVDEYSVWDGEQQHRAINKGSIEIDSHPDAELMHPKNVKPTYLRVKNIVVHLPPYQTGEDEWKKLIDISLPISIKERSGGFTSAMPYPNPHIELTETCSLEEARELVKNAAHVYEVTQDSLLANRDDTLTGLEASRARRNN